MKAALSVLLLAHVPTSFTAPEGAIELPPIPPPRQPAPFVPPPDYDYSVCTTGGIDPRKDCDDLRRLEGAAFLGKLSHDQLVCLEERASSVRAADPETAREVLGLLLVDASSRGRRDRERMLQIHLARLP